MIFFAITLTLIGNLQLFEKPFILVDVEKGVAQSVMTTAIFMYRLAFSDGDFGTASALSWVLLLIIAACTRADDQSRHSRNYRAGEPLFRLQCRLAALLINSPSPRPTTPYYRLASTNSPPTEKTRLWNTNYLTPSSP